jgi:hypothetical protein
MDVPGFRTYNAKFITKIRSAEEVQKLGLHALKDGTVLGWRWTPTEKGLALSMSQKRCASPRRPRSAHSRSITALGGTMVLTRLECLAGALLATRLSIFQCGSLLWFLAELTHKFLYRPD